MHRTFVPFIIVKGNEGAYEEDAIASVKKGESTPLYTILKTQLDGSQRKPDWSSILKDKENKLFSLIVLDNSTGYLPEKIASFDYEKLLSCFDKVFELRKADYREFPIFGFVFIETDKGNTEELSKILNSDLREFVILKK